MRYKWKQKTAGENTARTELNLAGKTIGFGDEIKRYRKKYYCFICKWKAHIRALDF